MRFMSLWKPGVELSGPPSEEEMVSLNALIAEMKAEGTLVATDGLQASAKGARVRLENGKATVTDGPFTETKELIAGYAILECRSKEHAIELARRFLQVMGGQGECEVRLMHEEPDCQEDAA